MPGLVENFFANKSFVLVAAALAFLGAAILISVIFRFSFGRGLRLPRQGRGRLPRLGTVDAFDLDRQRQLVIIRRDNVEHLLMIGGPNDLVIESQIIRAESREPRDFREARLRDKELRDKEAMPAAAGWPSPADLPSPNQPQRKMPFVGAAAMDPETGGMTGVRIEEPAGLAPSAVPPSPKPPPFPMPPRRPFSAAAPSGPGIPNHRESPYGRPVQRPDVVTNPAKEFRRASVATPFLRASMQRPAEAAAFRLAPSSGLDDAPVETATSARPSAGIEENPVLPDVDAAAETGAAPARPAAVANAPGVAADEPVQRAPAIEAAHAGVDTLETEMAKLLGRGPG